MSPVVHTKGESASGLVQIKRGSVQHTALSKLLHGPFVDKFFFCGALAAFIGIGYHGIHLWLMLHGQMEMADDYIALRRSHTLIQIYLFLDLFLYGFLMQSTAKLYEAPILPPATTFLLLPALLLGVSLEILFPEQVLGNFLLAICPAAVALWVCHSYREGRSTLREWHARYVLCGLAVLFFQPFFDQATPRTAMLFLILGVLPIMLAATQQFIVAFLGGVRLGDRLQIIVLVGVILSGLALAISGVGVQVHYATQISGASFFLSLLAFSRGTNLYRLGRAGLARPLSFAFSTGFIWALLSAGVMVSEGDARLDVSFHLFVLGLVFPLIVATSTQIVRHLTESVSLSEEGIVVLLAIWQLVPFGRAAPLFGGLPAVFSVIVAIAASVTLCGWLFALGSGMFVQMRRQFHGVSACPLIHIRGE